MTFCAKAGEREFLEIKIKKKKKKKKKIWMWMKVGVNTFRYMESILNSVPLHI